MSRQLTVDQRQKLLQQVLRLANIAVFGTLSESYRTCGRQACRCYGDGPKHGPHLHISYRGADGKTTGYYVPKAAQPQVRAGVAAWSQIHEILRQIAEMNAQQAIDAARTGASSSSRKSRRKITSRRGLRTTRRRSEAAPAG